MSESKSPSEIDRYVSERLRSRRTELDVTQEALAAQLGVTFQQLQKYENGKNRISAGRLYELAQALETTISYFFRGIETVDEALGRRGLAEDRGTDDASGFVDRDAVALMTAFQEISDPKVRKNILALVKSQAAADKREAGDKD